MSSGYALTMAACESTKKRSGNFSNSSKVFLSVGSLASQTTIKRRMVFKKISIDGKAERSV